MSGEPSLCANRTSQRFTGSASQKEAARVMRSEHLEQGRREREEYRSSKIFLRQQESHKVAETLVKMCGVGRIKMQDSALGIALCNTSDHDARGNRLWGREGDSCVAASLRHRGSTRMRKSSASPLENSFRRSVRSSNSKQSGASLAADSEPASPPVPDSVVVCSPVWSNTSSDSSQESKKLLLSEKEEAKKWWLEKVAKERQMMQMRKSFLQVK